MQVAAVQVVMEQIIYDKIYTCRCIVEDYHHIIIILLNWYIRHKNSAVVDNDVFEKIDIFIEI